MLLAKTRANPRPQPGEGPGGALTCGAISVDTGRRACLRGAGLYPSPPGSMNLLLCLLRHRGQVLSREQLLDQVWGNRL